MIRLITITLILLTAAAGCKKDDDESLVINPCGLDFNTSINYAAIGDEFSAGLFLSEGEAWPNDVVAHIEGLGYVLNEFVMVGADGSETNDVLSTWNAAGVKNCTNLATIMTGTHDLLTGASAEQFKTDYLALVSSVALSVTDLNHITCVTLPDYSSAPGLPSSAGTTAQVLQRITAYNAVIQEVADELGVQVADIFPPSQVSYNVTLAEDDFHPNADQHSLWANSISFTVENGLAE